MPRFLLNLFLAFSALPTVIAAADAPAGNWKVFLPLSEQGDNSPWLVQFEKKEGLWSGKVLAVAQGVPPSKLSDVKFTDGKLSFVLDLTEVQFHFEGNLPKGESKRLRGAFLVKADYIPGELEQTTLTSFDNFTVQQHVLATKTEGMEVIRASFTVLSQAEARKAKVEDVKKWADAAITASTAYGPWSKTVVLDLAELLTAQKAYASVALSLAQRAEAQLGENAPIARQKRTLDVLAGALAASGNEGEAKKVKKRSDDLPWVQVTKYAGRKAKSDRTVLVELFTGAQCPPCVAADLAFDALAETYSTKEVILLQYHLHIPGPDALTNADTERREEFYGKSVQGTPSIFFNGKPEAGGGGGRSDAQSKYVEYLAVLNPLLEKPSKAELTLETAQKDDTITIKANVAKLTEMGPDVRLRLVLVERSVVYLGRNGLPTHHHVVRDFPGGIAGLPLKENKAAHSATVKLSELRNKLKTYLAAANEKNPFPTEQRPLKLEGLTVVGFIQNDETGEILQATQVDVAGK